MNKRKALTNKEKKEKMKTLGGRICLARINAGLTQSDLGNKLKLDDQTISNYERNINTDNITFKQIEKMCEVLAIDYDYLCGNITHSTKELDIICKYTGLSEAAAKKLHNLNNHFVYKQFPEMLSNLLCNYYMPFFKLIITIFQYLSFRVEEHLLNPVINTDNWDELDKFFTQEKAIKDSASIALVNCIHEIDSMQEVAKKDKMIQEQISLRKSFEEE